MEPKWAEENLQTIRTLMERSAVYRRALAPIMLFAGLLGVTAAATGCHTIADAADATLIGVTPIRSGRVTCASARGYC